ncbi:ATP-binding protein [Ectobacillus sp. sgz5001026]|uniref:ATP-binding protein n=1 Tax=Ectobacillus sp. sgz5001026 TaxID=3242473 RepID=UPI0036D35238
MLIILISTLTYHLFWVQKGKQHPKLSSFIFIILSICSAFLCITFAAQPFSGYRFDMRQIVLISSTYIGGPVAGGIVWVAMNIYRLFWGGIGGYNTLLASTILFIVLIFTRRIYIQSTFSKKIVLSIFISAVFSGGWIPFFIAEVGPKEYMDYIIVYQLCSTFGTILILYLIEILRSQVKLQDELMNAEKFQLIGEMAASISHEIRNPLTSTRGFLQLLQSGNCSREEQKVYLDIAINGIDQANHVLTDYLTFAKPSIDKMQTLDLHHEIANVLSLITPMANFANVIIQYSPPHYSSSVLGEKQKLHQCLLNILKNSIEAMPTGGTLTISTKSYEQEIELLIEDTGIGMNEDQLKRLGSPFYSTKEKGTGLGMMVVFSVIKAMGGTIAILSNLDNGTKFKLRFPIVVKMKKT